jgi:hypothetical protein
MLASAAKPPKRMARARLSRKARSNRVAKGYPS